MDYMQKAINEGFKGMRANEGGPFGAVIVKTQSKTKGVETKKLQLLITLF